MCGAGRVVCLIDPIGDVYACPFVIHDEFKAGSVRDAGGFAHVWKHSDLFVELREPQSAGACAQLRQLRRLPGRVHGGQVLHRPAARRARPGVRQRPRRGLCSAVCESTSHHAPRSTTHVAQRGPCRSHRADRAPSGPTPGRRKVAHPRRTRTGPARLPARHVSQRRDGRPSQGRRHLDAGVGQPRCVERRPRLLGAKWGAVVFFLDAVKGAVPALAGLALDTRPGAYILVRRPCSDTCFRPPATSVAAREWPPWRGRW